MPSGLVPGETPLLGLETDAFSLFLPVASPLLMKREMFDVFSSSN